MGGVTRRAFVDSALKSSALSLAFAINGTTPLLSPQQARARQVPLQKLTGADARILELLGDTILPGAVDAGLIHFIDHELGVDANQCLLIAKYFQVAPPFADFYATGSRLATSMARKLANKSVEDLDKADLQSLVKEMIKPGFIVNGFSPFTFYMCLRSDAVDVVYGTPAGFERLNIPFMQHILPPVGWDG
jgi:hypothetical protein